AEEPAGRGGDRGEHQACARVHVIIPEDVSPPVLKGTISPGSTGTQGTTRKRTRPPPAAGDAVTGATWLPVRGIRREPSQASSSAGASRLVRPVASAWFT